MLSYRKLFSMLLIISVFFALCMLTQVYRETTNDYSTNEHAMKTVLQQPEDSHEAVLRERRAAFIGSGEDGMGDVLEQWCSYSKRTLYRYASLGAYLSQTEVDAGVLCIEKGSLSLPEEAALLAELAERDAVVVFGGLPEPAEIENTPELRELLGIQGVRTESAKLSGIYLYAGFLLGGDAVYRWDDDEELRAGLDGEIPWYDLQAQTNVYVTGLVGTVKEDAGQPNRPAILWRNTAGKARVFAINGDYLSEDTGFGFLSAIMAKSYSYALYPVVNAQNLAVADYPSFSSENEDEMTEVYSRSPRMLLQHIIWPNLVSLSEQSGFKMTFFMTPMLRYAEGEEAKPDALTFYLRQAKEIHGEMGWSAGKEAMVSVEEKWERDQAFFKSAKVGYTYTAVCASGRDESEILALADAGTAPDIRTLTGLRGEGVPLLGFVSEDITYQGVTHLADKYDFSADLKNRSLQTALGYTNILLDMGRIIWPETEDDRWEIYAKNCFGNIGTWWQRFACFERTTLTESDSRLRDFLSLDYEERREGNTIELEVRGRQGDVSFLLRTNEKSVKSVSGGTFSRVEEDIWLLTVQEDTVRIVLGNR